MKPPPSNISVASPANYKISVVGVLDESFTDRLGGLTISNTAPDQNTGKPVATLIGQLADQAALFGVLNALYNMRLPLLAVECISIYKKKEISDHGDNSIS
jgi:hypothetical protein